MGRKAKAKRVEGAHSAINNQRDQVLSQAHHMGIGQVASDIGQEQEVDSWRSYRNDTTNLQALNTQVGLSPFSPTAAPFVPDSVAQHQVAATASAKSHFTPYRPLRVSNGQHERHILQQARSQIVGQGDQSLNTHGGGRYALRGKREFSTKATTKADRPIPSIETSEPACSQFSGRSINDVLGQLGGRPINEALQRVTRQSESRASRTPTPPPAPKPTQQYMLQASLEPYRLEGESQKLLVVLDLNGTLLFRKNRGDPTSIQMRPGVTPLLEYLFENHVVMVYTSARPENATGMVNKLMHPKQREKLAAIWARDKLDLTTAQYNSKTQVYKKLQKIWNDPNIQSTAGEGHTWDQTNTILVDDSHLKAASQPYNLLQVPEFVNDRPQGSQQEQTAWVHAQSAILKNLQQMIERLGWQGDVSRQIRSWQIGTARQPVTSEEHQEMQTQKQVDADVQAEQLLTPKSPVEASSDNDSEDNNRGGVEVRSVSPIDEAVWSSILAGDEKDSSVNTVPPTPSSLDH